MTNSIRVILILFLFLIHCELGRAQIIVNDPYLDVFASSYVKSFDEFIGRFNADEYHPDIDTTQNDNLRLRSVLSLFDLQRFDVKDSLVVGQLLSFADTICRNDYRIDLESAGIYAEAQCTFTYNNQDVPINLVFVFENINDNLYKWALAGANGLVEASIMDIDSNGYIDPTQHELRFTELSTACSDLTKFMSIHKSVDQLSFLLGLLKSKQLQYVVCNKVRFHCVQVPGFVFVVEEVNRMSNNAGYLISGLFKTEGTQKRDYIEALLGNATVQ